jgi:hypothetical protein
MQAKTRQPRRNVIAFDLDDTLIPSVERFPTENLGFLRRGFAKERLRAGTPWIIRTLEKRGWDVWVYTTSFRSPLEIHLLFGVYGVRLRGVINQVRHERIVSRSGQPYRVCSKYPPAFGIDLLVDESAGVAIEGRRFGFPVVRILPDDPRWTFRLLDEIDRLAAEGLLPCLGGDASS